MVDIDTVCESCGVHLAGATQVYGDGKDVITPGTLSVCFSCGALGMYTEGNKIELLSKEDLQKIKSICENSYNTLLDAQKIIRERRKTC